MRDYDGKTAAERIAERRERLIDAGVELFGERGYAATSIRSVLQNQDYGIATSARASPISTRCSPPSTRG